MERVVTKHVYECYKCKGDVLVRKLDGEVKSCNIRRCKGCKHLFYAKGLQINCKEKLTQESKTMSWSMTNEEHIEVLKSLILQKKKSINRHTKTVESLKKRIEGEKLSIAEYKEKLKKLQDS